MDFVQAVLSNALVRNALVTGVLISIACGIVGSYVVTRRITAVAGGISHFILAGMGAARYLNVVHGWGGLDPIHGAVVSSLAAAALIWLVSVHAREREDTAIAAVWAVGMAVGLLFIARTPGYNVDLMGYLFGNILMVTPGELRVIIGLDLLVVAVALLFYKQLLAVGFDEEYARLRGLNADLYYLLLLGVTALTVVPLVTVVGIVMVIALLSLPVAVAGRFSNVLWRVMALASLFCIVFTASGLALSYRLSLPAGATIIITAGAVYLLVLVAERCLKTGRSARARAA